ncbi:hypothetical protein [Bordetella trematum]|uniref:hypothetical protein n=1 Tax=Bordetella trematum TaxID=123899 RepID=UPI00046EA6CA|nr:hypothetical protein [Bordetella trematum]
MGSNPTASASRPSGLPHESHRGLRDGFLLLGRAGAARKAMGDPMFVLAGRKLVPTPSVALFTLHDSGLLPPMPEQLARSAHAAGQETGFGTSCHALLQQGIILMAASCCRPASRIGQPACKVPPRRKQIT